MSKRKESKEREEKKQAYLGELLLDRPPKRRRYMSRISVADRIEQIEREFAIQDVVNSIEVQNLTLSPAEVDQVLYDLGVHTDVPKREHKQREEKKRDSALSFREAKELHELQEELGLVDTELTEQRRAAQTLEEYFAPTEAQLDAEDYAASLESFSADKALNKRLRRYHAFRKQANHELDKAGGDPDYSRADMPEMAGATKTPNAVELNDFELRLRAVMDDRLIDDRPTELPATPRQLNAWERESMRARHARRYDFQADEGHDPLLDVLDQNRHLRGRQ